MKKHLLALIFSVTMLSCFSQTIEVSGEVTGTWDVDTVRVVGDISVAPGLLLTINPGVLVQFTGHFTMTIGGVLRAVGTASDSIIFTIDNPEHFNDFSVPDGGWHGIYFKAFGGTCPDSSIMDFCNIHYVKGVGADSLDRYRGAIYADEFNRLRISNSTISNNFAYIQGAGIGLFQSSIVVSNCVIKDNVTSSDTTGHGAAFCAKESAFLLDRCIIDNNKSVSQGGAIYVVSCLAAKISNCIITNSRGSSGGALFFLDSRKMLFMNNLLCDNVSTYFGGALAGRNCDVNIVNCTIANNQSLQSGGGIYLSITATFNLYNTIIYNNSAPAEGQNVHIAYAESTCNFYFCDVEGGVKEFGGGTIFGGEYYEVLEENPAFIDVEARNYQLSDASPCINKGNATFIEIWLPETDLADALRVKNGEIDMGAFENQSLVNISEIQKNNMVRVYNVNEMLFFESGKVVKNVQIYNLNGILLKEIPLNVKRGDISLSAVNFSQMLVVRFVFENGETQSEKFVIN